MEAPQRSGEESDASSPMKKQLLNKQMTSQALNKLKVKKIYILIKQSNSLKQHI